MKDPKNTRLENFGSRNLVSPIERFAEYREQAKGLPKTKMALFWLRTLEGDPQVRELFETSGGVRNERRRRY
jgi:hypothetical protein